MNSSNTKGLDLVKLSDLMIKFSDKQQNVAAAMAKKQSNSSFKTDLQVLGDFTKAGAKLMIDPKTLFKVQQDFVKDYTAAGKKFMENLFFPKKNNGSDSVKDKRFKSEEWKKNPYFELLRDLYLINAKNLNQAVSQVKGLDEKSKKRVEFFTNQFTDAMSPSNFLMTNPELLKITMESGGENILEGFDKFLNDVSCEDGNLNIRISDPHAFELGRNVGTTKGSVVFQNDILQLIQYEPRTEKVFKIPLLISPPFINKFYILDINEKNSMVKWLVDQGYTVFMISWVNPGKEHAHKLYEDYVVEGHLEVLDVIKKITRQPKVSAIGYCTGGTLLATTAAYLQAKGEERFSSITYMATLMDFSEPGDLGNFLDESQVNQIIEDVKEVGYLDGRHLAKTFNMLKPNDLVWSYAVDKYLKGNEPVPFDILFWNSDSTNLPAEMYSFYLKNMYIENSFKNPGGISINGVDIDLSKITVPTYFLTTEDDHIVLWKASYKGVHLHSGKKRFVLGGSGHVAGVANPPVKNKYWYRWSDDIKDSAEAWLETATYEDGSWWVDWHDWNLEFAGNMVNKRVPGKGKFKELEPAPGSYAKKTIDKKVKCRENCSCQKESRKGITQIQASMPIK